MIILFSQNSIPFWGELTMWLNFPVKNLSHFEENWLCDYTFQPKKVYPILRRPDCDCNLWNEIYHILRGPDYVLYFPVKNLSHSEGTWLCDHNFQPKIYPIMRGPDYVIILKFPAKNLSHSEGTWLCDCNLWNEIYHVLRGPDYVIIFFSQKSVP